MTAQVAHLPDAHPAAQPGGLALAKLLVDGEPHRGAALVPRAVGADEHVSHAVRLTPPPGEPAQVLSVDQQRPGEIAQRLGGYQVLLALESRERALRAREEHHRRVPVGGVLGVGADALHARVPAGLLRACNGGLHCLRGSAASQARPAATGVAARTRGTASSLARTPPDSPPLPRNTPRRMDFGLFVLCLWSSDCSHRSYRRTPRPACTVAPIARIIQTAASRPLQGLRIAG